MVCAFCAPAQVPNSRSALNSPNRFSLNSRIGYNISARFNTTIPTSAASNPGPATGGGIDRIYDDGFVRRDGSGNRDGLTWYWGYANATQVPGNDTLLFNSHTTQGRTFTSHADGDPQLGLELNYGRVLGSFGPVSGAWLPRLAGLI